MRKWMHPSRWLFFTSFLLPVIYLSEIYIKAIRIVFFFYNDDKRTSSAMRLLWCRRRASFPFFVNYSLYGRVSGSISLLDRLVSFISLRRIRCWILSVGPFTFSNFRSFWSKNLFGHCSSSGIWMDNPIKNVLVVDILGEGMELCSGSGLRIILIFAHKFTSSEPLIKALPKTCVKVSFSQQ